MRRWGSRAWWGLAALLGFGALLGWWLPQAPFEWRPDRAWPDVWRWWTPAFLHLSRLHLAANVAGLVAVLAVGASAQVPARVAAAWALAWPLTHLLLLVQPGLARYVGLSGVLHAGVACVSLYLVLLPTAPGFDAATMGRRRWVGLGILVVLVGKVMSESPWGAPARTVEGWDIAVAPIAHATGVVAGLVAMGASMGVVAWFGGRASPSRVDRSSRSGRG